MVGNNWKIVYRTRQPMEFTPHYWKQDALMDRDSGSEDGSYEEQVSDKSESNGSLPRQSVMPRCQVAPKYSSKLSGSDYQPSNAEESASCVSSSNDSENDSVHKFIVTLPTKHAYKTVKFNDHSSSSESLTYIQPRPSKPAKPEKFSIKCFYKEQDDDGNLNGPRRRRAAMNVRYRAESESDGAEYSDEQSRGRLAKVHDSDSEFELSNGEEEEAEEEIMSFSSMSEESSDEYVPYSKTKRKGGNKRRGRRESSDDEYGGGWGRVGVQKQESVSESGSDYDPGGSYGKSRKKAAKKQKKKPKKYDSEESDYEGYTRTTGRRREYISYKESSSGQEGGESDKEEDEAMVASNAPPEVDDREKIERILSQRMGSVGDTGKTCYANTSGTSTFIEGNSDEDTEVQYLVKWKGWSHLHNTWESEATLAKANVAGIKRLHNYLKKEEERHIWENTATPEDIEYMKCNDEMNEQLLEQFKVVERVIDARWTEEGSGQEYMCKWKGLPYSESTWEDATLISTHFQDKIDEYCLRNDSDCIPSQSAKVIKNRPKFMIMKEQPNFLAGGRKDQLQLRDYQLDGVNWLVHTWCKNNSVILADEMGLGKTIQTISFLSCLFHMHCLYGPYLLVVPLSTLPAWQREFELWAPEMNVLIYIGDINSRKLIQQYEWAYDNNKLKFNAVVTTFEILLKDKDFLGSISWAVLTVDEAHRLKNDDSLLYRTLLTFHTNHRLLITGTPLQNSLRELWSLLYFIMRNEFSSWEEFESRHKAYGGDASSLSSLHQELEPYLLRRVKKDVEKSLPAKVEQILRVEMSSVQKQYYRWILTKNYKALSKGVKGSISGFLNIVMELKKCCNHTYLVRPPDTPDVVNPLQSLLRGSGKLYLLDKLLVRLKETGHRVLIFSQMVRLLDVLAEYMTHRHFQYQRLDGSITGQKRKDAIDHFNAEGSIDFCFLLSTRAGGLGVNLATADTVVIFDSDWNPQNDLQAQARAHRIGQTKQVNIYRFVTRSSVEEDIIERAKRKMVLDHLVIQKMDTTGRTILSKSTEPTNNVPFNKDELDAILKFGADELFKDDDKEDKALKEMDIDDILRRAETRDNSIEDISVGSELLSQFKVASFAMDEGDLQDAKAKTDRRASTTNENNTQSWDDIIPQSYRDQIDEEQKQKEQLQLYLPPRKRKVKSYYENNGAEPVVTPLAEQRERRGKPSPRKRPPPSERQSNEDIVVTRDVSNFNNAEIRRFVNSYRKFASPQTRLDAIAADAELQEKSLSDLEQLATLLHTGCEEAYNLQQQIAKENDTTDANMSKKPSATLRLGNVSIPVLSIVQRVAELQILSQCIPDTVQGRKSFRLVTRAKPVGWPGVKWTAVDDSRLLVGVYKHGLGNWEAIKDDSESGLSNKILSVSSEQKPQGPHLKTRTEYLLKLLKAEVTHRRAKDTKPKAPTSRKTKNSQPITKFLKSDNPKPNTRQKKKPTSSNKKYGESSSPDDNNDDDDDDDEDEDDNDNDDSEDSDFVEVKRTRGKKRPAPAKVESKSKKAKTTRTAPVQSRSNNKRTSKRATNSSQAKPSKRRPKRTVNKKNTSDIDSEEDIVDHELENELFLKCKSMLKPVKKHLMQLTPTPKQLSEIKTLVEIGNHIGVRLSEYSDKESVKLWKNNLWIFVSKFTALSAKTLYQLYKDNAS